MSEMSETTTISELLDDGEGIPEADTPTGMAEDAPARPHPFADLPLEDDGMPTVEALTNALRAVIDPEIGYNIVDLGLVYEVTKPQRGQVHVLMTLTSTSGFVICFPCQK